jgi:hypothetical protein
MRPIAFFGAIGYCHAKAGNVTLPLRTRRDPGGKAVPRPRDSMFFCLLLPVFPVRWFTPAGWLDEIEHAMRSSAGFRRATSR